MQKPVTNQKGEMPGALRLAVQLVAVHTCTAAKGVWKEAVCNRSLLTRGCLGQGGDLISRGWAALNLFLLIFQQRHQALWSNTGLLDRDKRCLLLTSLANNTAACGGAKSPDPGVKVRSSWVLCHQVGQGHGAHPPVSPWGWSVGCLHSGLEAKYLLQSLNGAWIVPGWEREGANIVLSWWEAGLAGGNEGSRDALSVLSRLGCSVFMIFVSLEPHAAKMTSSRKKRAICCCIWLKHLHTYPGIWEMWAASVTNLAVKELSFGFIHVFIYF